MRHTKKLENGYYEFDNYGIPEHGGHINKLGQLEDIEEELGIEFLKMKEISVIYVKTKDGLVYPMEEFGLDFRNKRIVGIITDHATLVSITVSAFFSDKGKTWALTKEELE